MMSLAPEYVKRIECLLTLTGKKRKSALRELLQR